MKTRCAIGGLAAIAIAIVVGWSVAPAAGATGLGSQLTGALQHALANDDPYIDSILPGGGVCEAPGLSAKRPVSLPADDAPHNKQLRNYWEWWYYRIHLETVRRHGPSRSYAFATVFESKPLLHIQKSDYTLIDLARQKLHEAHEGLILGTPASTSNGFSLHGKHVSAIGGDGHDHIHQELDGYVLDVSLTETKPPVLGFGTGYASFFCNQGFEYQRQRMTVTGTLTKNGKRMKVRGSGGFEHSWGLDPGYQLAQSDYLALELGDGTDVFLGLVRFPRFYDSRTRLPTVATLNVGSISDPAGNITILKRGDFKLTPTGYYRPSPTCRYPTTFDVELKGRHYRVKPSLPGSELRSTSVPLNNVIWAEDATIWDGPGTVSGDGTGHAWLDFVGYCVGR